MRSGEQYGIFWTHVVNQVNSFFVAYFSIGLQRCTVAYFALLARPNQTSNVVKLEKLKPYSKVKIKVTEKAKWCTV